MGRRKKADLVESMKHNLSEGIEHPPSQNPPSYQSVSPTASSLAAAAPQYVTEAEGSQKVTEHLRQALQTNERTNISATETIYVLGQQKEIITHSLETVGETRETLDEAGRTIRGIRWGIYEEYIWKGLVILLLLILLGLLSYVKFLK